SRELCIGSTAHAIRGPRSAAARGRRCPPAAVFPAKQGAMKLLVLTYGTEGDTRPLTMLCRGLMEAGHDVLLLADGGTLGSAKALNVPHAALEGDIHDEVVALVSRGNGVAAASTGLARMALQHVGGWMLQADAAARGCDAILTGGLAAFV